MNFLLLFLLFILIMSTFYPFCFNSSYCDIMSVDTIRAFFIVCGILYRTIQLAIIFSLTIGLKSSEDQVKFWYSCYKRQLFLQIIITFDDS